MSQSTKTSRRGPDPQSEDPLEFGSAPPAWVVLVRWVFIATSVAVVTWLAWLLVQRGNWLMVIIAAFVAMCVVAIYSTHRAVPAKYLFPGLLLMVAFQIWPLAYTVSMSFTNFGDGHRGTKEEAIAQIEANSVVEVEGGQRYLVTFAVPDGQEVATGDLIFLLTDTAGDYFAGSIDGLEPLEDEAVTVADNGQITAADGYLVMSPSEVNQRSADVSAFGVPTETGGIRNIGLREAFEGQATRVYDPEQDVIVDQRTGQRFIEQDARFVPEDGVGQPLPQGWRENVGFENFTRALSDPVLRDGLLNAFVWNIVFAAGSVLTTFILGLALALLMNDPRLKGKAIYRSLLILPYALPIYVTALVWASMFNPEFGLINNITGLGLNWLGDPTLAKVAILTTNLWLGFPYMFIVCTGALQSIPDEVKEAAAIDGASAFRTVRSVITPLLLVAVGPLLIASFAFNFNNFGLIFLMTEGGPFVGGQSQFGSTDLLITLAYRLAIGGTTPNYGFAAAISVFIFFLVAGISYLGFRRTKALEDVN